ncbi:TPA: DUF2304 domain-containing protein [Candidatus Woesearchaeota archaeon]|nr:DUF2304 domain-containing protein [Candidatus Woesearchaeota archaeon]
MALIMGIQVIGILFALFMLYYTFINYKRDQLQKSEFGIWLTVWLVFLAVSIYPFPLQTLARTLSIWRTMDFLTIIGFFFILTLTFYNYVQVRKNNQKLEKLVRKLAFKQANKETKNRK